MKVFQLKFITEEYKVEITETFDTEIKVTYLKKSPLCGAANSAQVTCTGVRGGAVG